MIVTIHQPEHLVWLGLIKKIKDADIFVALDDVQFKKNNYQNRNRIRTGAEWKWLTVPLNKHPLSAKINEVEIAHGSDWLKKYLQSLRIHYGKAAYFKDYFPKIENIVVKKHEKLADLNMEIIRFLLSEFDVKTKVVRSSEMGLPAAVGGSDICLNICKNLGAMTYISGPDGAKYLRLKDFENAGINVLFHEFAHPVYEQVHGEFMPYMSSLDALFNLGPEARKLL